MKRQLAASYSNLISQYQKEISVLGYSAVYPTGSESVQDSIRATLRNLVRLQSLVGDYSSYQLQLILDSIACLADHPDLG